MFVVVVLAAVRLVWRGRCLAPVTRKVGLGCDGEKVEGLMPQLSQNLSPKAMERRTRRKMVRLFGQEV